jgi:hypothetical protein
MPTQEQKLKKIIEKAVENGLKIEETMLLCKFGGKITPQDVATGFDYTQIIYLIFSKPFLKAYFGEEVYYEFMIENKETKKYSFKRVKSIDWNKEIAGKSGIPIDSRENWQYQAQQLVLEDDKIDYLSRFLDE